MRSDKLTRVFFTLPFLIPLALFWIFPLLAALGISLTDWDYISLTANFVGFENYADIVTGSDFATALWNTLVFSVGTIVPIIVFGLLFALIFQQAFTGGRIYQLIIFSPWITPAVAVSLVWSWIYDPDQGLANHMLALFHIAPLQWLHSSDTAMLGIVIFTVWKSVGWTMLFYVGALERVPQSNYEAAELDGANYVQRFWHITLPIISPTTFFLFIVNLITAIQVYDQIQIMTQGGPGRSTTTLLYLYYDKAFQNFQMGSANAVAIVILVIIIALSLLSSLISRKWVHHE